MKRAEIQIWIICALAMMLGATLALSGCAAMAAAMEPHARVARALAAPRKGECLFFYASSGLPWQPIQELAVCNPLDPATVYVAAAQTSQPGSFFSNVAGPIGGAVDKITPTISVMGH